MRTSKKKLKSKEFLFLSSSVKQLFSEEFILSQKRREELFWKFLMKMKYSQNLIKKSHMNTAGPRTKNLMMYAAVI